MKVMADADDRRLPGAGIPGLNGAVVRSLLDVMAAQQPHSQRPGVLVLFEG